MFAEKLPSIEAYATMYVSFNGQRFPISYGELDETVNRPFWNAHGRNEDAIFPGEILDKFREVMNDYMKPENEKPYKIPYNKNDVPGVLLWSEETGEYMVIKDRDKVSVELKDVFGSETNTHKAQIIGMRTNRRSPRETTARVENEHGDTITVSPRQFRGVLERSPGWEMSDKRSMVRK